MSTTPRSSLPAPTVPNMIPGHGRPNAPATVLDLLKIKLRKYSHLLDHIPIDKVEMTFHNTKLPGFIPHGIPIATINDDDGECWTAWALMSTNKRNDGLPDIWIYAIHWLTGDIKHHKIDSVAKGSYPREGFKPVMRRPAELSAILKACFILKGAQFPDGIDFTTTFLRELRSACRRYMEGTSSNEKLLGNAGCETVESTSTLIPKHEATANALTADKHKLKSVPLFDNGYDAPRDPSRLRSEIASGTMTLQPQVLVANPFSLSLSSPTKGPTSLPVIHNGVKGSSAPHADSAIRALRASRLVPAVPHTRNHDPTGSMTPTRAATADKLVHQHDLDEYLDLHAKQSILSSQLRDINDRLEQNKNEVSVQLKVSNDRIKADLKPKHDTERQDLQNEQKRQQEALDRKFRKESDELHRQQQKEADERNKEHAQLKAKLAQEKDALQEQKRIRLQAKNAIKEELDRKRESFTREQLLGMVDSLTPLAIDKKRKRSDGDGELDGH